MHSGLLQCGQETQGFSVVLILITSSEEEESGPTPPHTYPRVQRDPSPLCNPKDHYLDGSTTFEKEKRGLSLALCNPAALRWLS